MNFFNSKSKNAYLLLFSIYQPFVAADKCRQVPAPDRSVLENEFFNTLLDVVRTLLVPRVYSFSNLSAYDLGYAARAFMAFAGGR